MKKVFLIFSYLLLSLSAFSQTHNQRFLVKSYEQAEKSKSFLRYDMESTKIVVTTGFAGFVKDFTVSGNFYKMMARDIKISFPVSSMDSDNSDRDAKMHNKCLNVKKYPKLSVELSHSIFYDGKTYPLKGILHIQDRKLPIVVNAKITATKTHYIVEGNAELQYSDLKIPNPSFWAATLEELIRISFKLELKK